MAKRTVVLGLLGTTLDSGTSSKRWHKWRPTVDLCRHEDLLVDRLELISDPRHDRLANVVAKDIANVSPQTEVRHHPVTLKNPWDFEEVYAALHDFVRAYNFRPERERYLVHVTTGTHVAQICWFLLTESHHVPGELVQVSPPSRRSADPVGDYSTIDLDLSKYDRIARRFRREHEEGVSFLKSGIQTKNRAFNELIARIERVALASAAPMLITGPTGAGKSRLARRIYELVQGRGKVGGAYVEVNCATLRGDAAMSALFGHKRGAFTGAIEDRPGLLRSADGGVLFLDEIGELGVDEQAMLLRALEERRFLPVGADAEVSSDFRLIAGTNRDLGRAVEEGRFREDLLARINLWTFELPGLADRREDIEPNLDYELERFTDDNGQMVTFTREARRRFLTFARAERATWRRNFRDLNAAVVRMATLAPEARIDARTVDDEIERLTRSWGATAPDALPVDRPLDRFDRVQLEEVMKVCKGAASLSAAGRVLFAESRKAKANPNDADRLRKYLARYGLTFDEVR
ncbi:MAG: RNA repair transcriptional activator RtcR [Deltaproteobacteria bacterium]|jgi:transcriptional regulatory protein RtcR